MAEEFKLIPKARFERIMKQLETKKEACQQFGGALRENGETINEDAYQSGAKSATTMESLDDKDGTNNKRENEETIKSRSEKSASTPSINSVNKDGESTDENKQNNDTEYLRGDNPRARSHLYVERSPTDMKFTKKRKPDGGKNKTIKKKWSNYLV